MAASTTTRTSALVQSGSTALLLFSSFRLQVEYIVLNDTSADFPAVCKYCGLRYFQGARAVELLRPGAAAG